MKHVCLGFGTERCTRLTTAARCPRHARLADRARQAKRGNLYDWSHRVRSREQREAAPQCEWCGSTEDLTADHVRPGDPTSRLRTLCRSCNTTRANRARARRRA